MEIKKEISFYIPDYRFFNEPVLVKMNGWGNDVLLFAENERLIVRVYSYNLKKYETLLDVPKTKENYERAVDLLGEMINTTHDYFFECDDFYGDHDVN